MSWVNPRQLQSVHLYLQYYSHCFKEYLLININVLFIIATIGSLTSFIFILLITASNLYFGSFSL